MSMLSEQVKELRRCAALYNLSCGKKVEGTEQLLRQAAGTIEALSEKVRAQSRCPVGGVDRSGKVDRIPIQNAVETPFWMAVWATEPERPVDVRMSYSDLKVICDLIDKASEAGGEAHGHSGGD